MFSLRSTLVAAVALIAGVQAEYFIEPSSVPVSTRNNWCTSQRTQCTPICLDFAPQSGRPLKNTCDAATLTYECVCGNNQSPNLTEYSQTMPYHKCVQFQTNCITNCGASNNACSSKCQNDIKCGASSPKGATNATASTTDGSNSPATTTSSSGTQLQTNAFGGGGGGGGSSMGATSTSLQTSLTLAVSIAGILIGPLLL